MPIRRLNFTKRKKLSRDQVQIRLLPKEAGKARAFHAELTLPKDLPEDAEIFVEAQRSSPFARMRFAFGTVGSRTIPSADDLRLVEFAEDLPAPRFRIKVTGVGDAQGRLLADAENIHPVDPDDEPDKRRGILFISWQDNDGPVWILDLDDNIGPHLIIDPIADPFHELPQHAFFKGLVYPEIIRRVLTHVLIDDPDSVDDPTGWQRAWIALPLQAFGFTDSPPLYGTNQEKLDWVETAMRWCSKRADLVKSMAPAESEG